MCNCFVGSANWLDTRQIVVIALDNFPIESSSFQGIHVTSHIVGCIVILSNAAITINDVCILPIMAVVLVL